MPCWNAGPYLRSSVDSVVSQLSDQDELIVQDACSTDGSAEVLDAAAAANSGVSVRHEPDGGQSDALNRALRRARNDLICWVNADDLLLPGALDAVRAAISGHGAVPDLVVGAWQMLAPDGQVIRRHPAAALERGRLLVWGCYAFSGAVLIRRDMLVACGGFTENLHYVMDFDLMLKLADTAADQLVIDHSLAALRFHTTAKSSTCGTRFLTEAFGVRWRGLRGPREVVRAAAGSALHAVGVATLLLRYAPTYSRLRRKATSS
ncbi:glycosyltransferase [Lentzea atacamensis]|nr:glycosyltransferase [Lentzea atacamensis]